MFKHSPSHGASVALALFVTFLWSTSWVLIKWGLEDIPALTFAGLRYVLAALCLLPFALRPSHMSTLRAMPVRTWIWLGVYGLVFISVAQGGQFLALAYLPAITGSLVLTFTTVLVALMGIWLLREIPSPRQWGGVCLYLLGVALYFYPTLVPTGDIAGLIAAGVCVLATAGASVMGRYVNRGADLHPLTVTVVSMSVGAVALLATGIAAQGLPVLLLGHWAIVAWLAVVNTAFAFTLWNYTLRTLSAVESSIINSTMLVQIALLAWLFLGETLSAQQIAGMLLVGVAIVAVSVRRES